MGYYRFILSVMVLLSHSGLYIFGVNQGTVAVISFLLITGYTTDIAFKKYTFENFKDIKEYYLNRITRIYPQYIIYIVMTGFIIGGLGVQHETVSHISLKAIFYNLLLIPLNYSYLFKDVAETLQKCIFIPAAWTMGLQLTWWFLAPIYKLIINKNIFGKVIMGSTIVVSIVLWVLSIFGKVNPSWAESFIFSTFWIFAIGLLINRNKLYFVGGAWVFVLALTLMLSYRYELINSLNREVLIGLLIGIPVIYLLKYFPRNKMDNLFGMLSYGIYLNHFTLKSVMCALIGHQPNNLGEWGVLIIVSACVAYIVDYLVKTIKNTYIAVRKNKM